MGATDALGQQTAWAYDAGGQVVAQRDPRGNSYDLSYSYDALGRQTRVESAQLTAPIVTAYNGQGQRQSLQDATGTTSFSYDALGRLTGVTAPDTGTVGYGYSARGERIALTYPDTTQVAYAYWPDGQLQTVTQGGAVLASYTYDTTGRLDVVTRANGATTSSAYDGADRLTALHTTVGGSTVSRFQYTVDRLGLRTGVTETLLPTGTRSISYTYDGLLRLTGAVESTGASYAYDYDLAGNRTSVTANGSTTTTAYNAANQVAGWSYDAAGNLLNDGTSTSTYDALGRMTSRNGTSYRYNGDGVLVAQTAAGNATRYTQDLVSSLSMVLNDGSANYIYGHERLGAQAGGTTTWYGTDALGSVRQVLDNAGIPFGTASYDPWGMPQGSAISPFGFTGELQDAAGLTYLRARWYTSIYGVLLGRDPFAGWPEQPYSLHPFQYGYSNPVNNSDPSGKIVIFFHGGWDDTSLDPLITELKPGINGDILELKANDTSTAYKALERFNNSLICLAESIILIGYSRGGASVQAVANTMSNFAPLMKIQLAITIAPVEFGPGPTHLIRGGKAESAD